MCSSSLMTIWLHCRAHLIIPRKPCLLLFPPSVYNLTNHLFLFFMVEGQKLGEVSCYYLKISHGRGQMSYCTVHLNRWATDPAQKSRPYIYVCSYLSVYFSNARQDASLNPLLYHPRLARCPQLMQWASAPGCVGVRASHQCPGKLPAFKETHDAFGGQDGDLRDRQLYILTPRAWCIIHLFPSTSCHPSIRGVVCLFRSVSMDEFNVTRQTHLHQTREGLCASLWYCILWKMIMALLCVRLWAERNWWLHITLWLIYKLLKQSRTLLIASQGASCSCYPCIHWQCRMITTNNMITK